MTTSACKNIFFLLICFSFLKISSQTITTVAGNGTGTYSGDGGQAVSASLNNPRDVGFDASGNMYIADRGNHRIRKVTPGGVVSTFAGTGAAGYSGDGGQATSAQLNGPQWLYFDNSSGSLYISEPANYVIRKVNAQGVISTAVGTGSGAAIGRTMGLQATNTKIYMPGGVVIGPDKKLYFGEWQGPSSRVLVVDTFGVINIFVGQSDPPGSPFKTQIANPSKLMFDAAGNLYIGDSGNYKVIKITSAGTATLFAGVTGGTGISGNGGPAVNAAVSAVQGMLRDNSGNIYLAADNVIRAVNTAGTINAFAGVIGGTTNLGDGGPITLAGMAPTGLAFGPDGNMYIADPIHHRIRRIGLTSQTLGIKKIDKTVIGHQLFPNPAHSALNFAPGDLDGKALTIEITDITGKRVLIAQTNNLSTLQVNLSALKPGVYYATVCGSDIRFTEKFIKE